MGEPGGFIGRTIGSYRLLSVLGQGGFGEVYYGEHLYLGTPVAVKLLNAQREQGLRDLIRAEAHTSARLIHPHIIQILDFGFEGDIPYLVMVYAPNGTLRKLHPRGTVLAPQRVAFYLRQIAQALQYAHDRKLIHRDVKPENMLLDTRNEILLSDFGIAVGAHDSQSLSAQDPMGTVAYMAPEQAEGKARPASDQYALAICAYEWLSGHPPFVGASTIEVALKHQQEQPSALSTTNPYYKGALPALQQIVMKALAKDPHRRFPSVLAFAEAFERASEEADIPQGSTLVSYRGHVDYVNTLAWSPDGRWIASGACDGTVQVWEAATGRLYSTYLGHTDPVYALAWSPDGASLVSGGDDHSVQVWRALDGIHQTTYQGHTEPIGSLSWSPDGKRVASGSVDRTVQIWDAQTGTPHLTYRGHTAAKNDLLEIHALAWSPPGFYLASGSEEGTLQIWDTATGKQHHLFQEKQGPIESLAWLSNGTRLFCGGTLKAMVWDSLKKTFVLTYVSPDKGTIWCSAPSPDGQYVASGEGSEANSFVRIWRLSTGEQVFAYRGHSQRVAALAWSPDGKYIASASDKELHVWTASNG